MFRLITVGAILLMLRFLQVQAGVSFSRFEPRRKEFIVEMWTCARARNLLPRWHRQWSKQNNMLVVYSIFPPLNLFVDKTCSILSASLFNFLAACLLKRNSLP